MSEINYILPVLLMKNRLRPNGVHYRIISLIVGCIVVSDLRQKFRLTEV
jgi:hypothetical protein